SLFRVVDDGDVTKQFALQCSSILSGTTATFTAPNYVGAVTTLASAPTAGGAGYTTGDVLTITTGGSGATCRVTTVAAGAVTAVTLVKPGIGYTTGTGKATTGGSGSGCTVNITAVTASADGTFASV